MYRTGTPNYGGWSKTGRKFPSMGSLRQFITLSIKKNTVMSDWIIEESQLVPISDKEVSDIITPKKLLELLSK